MKITAKELYEAVWTKPVRTLAKEWGLSDTGLAKICRKNGIPLPRVGHWARVAVGRGYLRPQYDGLPDVEIVFDGMPSLKRPLLSDEAKQRTLAGFQRVAQYFRLAAGFLVGRQKQKIICFQKIGLLRWTPFKLTF